MMMKDVYCQWDLSEVRKSRQSMDADTDAAAVEHVDG